MKEALPGGTFRVEAGIRPASIAEEVSNRPFLVALLGDFSGRSARGAVGDSSDVSGRTPRQVDRDDLDAVLGRLEPSVEITLPNGEGSVELSFTELEDFHPDRLFDHPALFGALKAKRDEIADPKGFAKFKEQLKEKVTEQAERPADDAPPRLLDGNLLDQILDDSSTQAASAVLADGGLQEFVRRAVAPHEMTQADPTQTELLAQMDAQIASRMRWVLHSAEFQALEALWRGVSFLCRRVETSPTLKLFLIDISMEELRRDQSPEVPLEKSGLYRLLVESSVGTPGTTPWSLFVGCHSFGPQMDDLKLLARIGAITSLANACWLSAADSALVGCPSFGTAPDPDQWDETDGEAWDAVRLLPYAGRVGLVLPRFLLRLPYGRETDECERLAVEETAGDGHEHEEYLWGNPALLSALLVIHAYAPEGSDKRVRGNLEIDKLPLHLRKTADETVAQPCAEALLSERALTQISDRGLMALASRKDRDAVRLLRFQSVSHPPTALEGPWL
jgi:type VI secretion system protein ImpC